MRRDGYAGMAPLLFSPLCFFSNSSMSMFLSLKPAGSGSSVTRTRFVVGLFSLSELLSFFSSSLSSVLRFFVAPLLCFFRISKLGLLCPRQNMMIPLPRSPHLPPYSLSPVFPTTLVPSTLVNIKFSKSPNACRWSLRHSL